MTDGLSGSSHRLTLAPLLKSTLEGVWRQRAALLLAAPIPAMVYYGGKRLLAAGFGGFDPAASELSASMLLGVSAQLIGAALYLISAYRVLLFGGRTLDRQPLGVGLGAVEGRFVAYLIGTGLLLLGAIGVIAAVAAPLIESASLAAVLVLALLAVYLFLRISLVFPAVVIGVPEGFFRQVKRSWHLTHGSGATLFGAHLLANLLATLSLMLGGGLLTAAASLLGQTVADAAMVLFVLFGEFLAFALGASLTVEAFRALNDFPPSGSDNGEE